MARTRYLVAYDIRDDKRLRQVHKTMGAFGWSMQYSVFICDLDEIEVLNLKSAILKIIQSRADSVAVIRLGSPTERRSDASGRGDLRPGTREGSFRPRAASPPGSGRRGRGTASRRR